VRGLVAGVNIQAHIIGPRGVGKTTIARSLVKEHVTEGGWAFIHDPMRQFTDMARTYDSPMAWKREVANAATRKLPLHRAARFTCKSAELVKLCVELGERHNRAKNIRFPMMLVVDEGSKHSSSGQTHMSREDNEALSTIRHLGVATVFNQQRLNQFPMQFYEMASDLYLFRLSAKRLDELEEALAIPPGSLDGVPHLFAPDPDIGPTASAPAEYIHVRYGKGPV
jgi:hypothetical protein